MKEKIVYLSIKKYGYVQTLVYADNLLYVADTVGNLQKQINIIQNCCIHWGMKVNFDKT